MAIRRPLDTNVVDVTGADLASDIAISTTGNIATTGSGTLTSAGAFTASGGIANTGTITAGTLGSSVVFPAGKVVQTKLQDGYGQVELTTHSFNTNDVICTTLFTPLFASSKLLLVAHICCYHNTAAEHIWLDFYKNASDFTETANLSGFTYGIASVGSGGHNLGRVMASYAYLDNAGSTTEKTYKISAKVNNNAGTDYLGVNNNNDHRSAFIQIMEIAQ
jgi:hypothetical protein